MLQDRSANELKAQSRVSAQFRMVWDKLSRFAREFIRGATRPSMGAALGAICITTSLLLLSCSLLTEHRISRLNPNLLKANGRDDFTKLTISALRLALTHSARDKPSVVLIGDSAFEQAITSERDLIASINSAYGKDVKLHLLLARGMTHWDMVKLVDRVSSSVHGIIIVGVAPAYLSQTSVGLQVNRSQNRIALDSAAYERELQKADIPELPNWRNYFLNNIGFFLARKDVVLPRLLHPPRRNAPAIGHPYDRRPPWGRREWARMKRRVYGWQKNYAANHTANLAVYDRMLEQINKQPNLRMVLLEDTMNGEGLDAPDHASPGARAMRSRYMRDVSAFASDRRIPYWDLAAEAQLKPNDFLDWIHVVNVAARSRYTDVLASHIAELLLQQNKSDKEGT